MEPDFRVQSHGTGRSLLVVVSAYITKGHAKLLFRSQRYSSSEAERRGRTYDGRAVWLRQFTDKTDTFLLARLGFRLRLRWQLQDAGPWHSHNSVSNTVRPSGNSSAS